MRIFFSTGEASGELCAVVLAQELAASSRQVTFEGIGGDRMREVGMNILADTDGWATLGPISALRNIPHLLSEMRRVAKLVVASPPDIVVLIDFGAFNVRFARALRYSGYAGPIVYGFPPSAWLDRPKVARAVAALATPVVPFRHQRDFYTSLGLPVHYFGHPIAATIKRRNSQKSSTFGKFVFFPGSRQQEIDYNLPRMVEALLLLREELPNCEAVVVAANARIATYLESLDATLMRIERDSREWLSWADVACVASGTAVLESVLSGVPTVAMYALSPINAMLGRLMYRGRYVTIPNLVLGRMAIPELLQSAATPQALAQQMLDYWATPRAQEDVTAELLQALDCETAIPKWAGLILSLAQNQR